MQDHFAAQIPGPLRPIKFFQSFSSPLTVATHCTGGHVYSPHIGGTSQVAHRQVLFEATLMCFTSWTIQEVPKKIAS